MRNKLFSSILSFPIVISFFVTIQQQKRDPRKTDTGPSWANSEATAIGFSSRRSGHFNLYSKDLVSGKVVQITSDTVDQHYPVWSPDGNWIAYQTVVDGNQEIFIRSTKSDQVINISNHPGRDGDDYPEWSKDSRSVYFTSRRNGNSDIFKKVIGEPGLEQITDGPGDEMNPQLSPDGQRIAFAQGGRGQFDIYIMKTDGSQLKQVTHTDLPEMFPTWHPDGKTLIYQTRITRSQADIFRINIDGSNEENITKSEGVEFYPRISPDGKKILYASPDDGDMDIYLLEISTGKITQLTN